MTEGWNVLVQNAVGFFALLAVESYILQLPVPATPQLCASIVSGAC